MLTTQFRGEITWWRVWGFSPLLRSNSGWETSTTLKMCAVLSKKMSRRLLNLWKEKFWKFRKQKLSAGKLGGILKSIVKSKLLSLFTRARILTSAIKSLSNLRRTKFHSLHLSRSLENSNLAQSQHLDQLKSHLSLKTSFRSLLKLAILSRHKKRLIKLDLERLNCQAASLSGRPSKIKLSKLSSNLRKLKRT